MKRLYLVFTIMLLCSFAYPQMAAKMPEIDRSPMDMCYYPGNYPILKIQNKISEPLLARVIYSRPQKQGRKVFGELVEYGTVWRLGANEATEIEFYKDVKIDGKKISKGRYTLYALVNENKWTMILNKETDIWGAFKYDAKKDIARVDVPVEKNDESLETLSMVFDKTNTGIALIIAWDQVKVSMPVSL